MVVSNIIYYVIFQAIFINYLKNVSNETFIELRFNLRINAMLSISLNKKYGIEIHRKFQKLIPQTPEYICLVDLPIILLVSNCMMA